MLNKIFKIIGILILLAIIGFIVVYFTFNEPLPTGKQGAKADALAQKMLTALHATNYEDTSVLEWSFRGGSNFYRWEKNKFKVTVRWDDYTVDLDLINLDSSIVYEDGVKLPYSKSKNYIEKAQKLFNNDSFWLVAPFKVFDKGTVRSLITLEDGTNALLVTYTKGGDTPGDSYLWLLDSNGIPTSFRLWVKIIPIGGIQATWDGWKAMESGVLLPSVHKLGPISISMGNVKAYNP